jgi:hypothetical protein
MWSTIINSLTFSRKFSVFYSRNKLAGYYRFVSISSTFQLICGAFFKDFCFFWIVINTHNVMYFRASVHYIFLSENCLFKSKRTEVSFLVRTGLQYHRSPGHWVPVFPTPEGERPERETGQSQVVVSLLT